MNTELPKIEIPYTKGIFTFIYIYAKGNPHILTGETHKTSEYMWNLPYHALYLRLFYKNGKIKGSNYGITGPWKSGLSICTLTSNDLRFPDKRLWSTQELIKTLPVKIKSRIMKRGKLVVLSYENKYIRAWNRLPKTHLAELDKYNKG